MPDTNGGIGITFDPGRVLGGIGRSLRGDSSHTVGGGPSRPGAPLTGGDPNAGGVRFPVPGTRVTPATPGAADTGTSGGGAQDRWTGLSSLNAGPRRRYANRKSKRKCNPNVDSYWDCLSEEEKISVQAQLVSLGAGSLMGGYPIYRSAPKTRGMVVPGSRTAQRGFVGEIKPKTEPLRQAARRRPTLPVAKAAPVIPQGPTQVPVVGVPDLQPLPQVAQPIPTAPDTREPKQLPHYEWTLRDLTIDPVLDPYARPGRKTSAPSPTRSPRPTRTPTKKPGKSGAGTRVALPRVGALVLSPDALLRSLLGRLRPSTPRQVARSVSPVLARARQTVAQPLPQSLTQFSGLRSLTQAKECECEKEKKKPRKPRQPRSVCYKGSYTETALGLKKRKREQVPCT